MLTHIRLSINIQGDFDHAAPNSSTAPEIKLDVETWTDGRPDSVWRRQHLSPNELLELLNRLPSYVATDELMHAAEAVGPQLRAVAQARVGHQVDLLVAEQERSRLLGS